jgi:hypothetical protein
MTLRSWRAILNYYAQRENRWTGWLFRGDPSNSRLESRLEKAANRYGISWSDRVRRERGLIREFKRHYHRYATSSPAPSDLIEWLSIMRHFGAPTRLVDWSYSFWVALYFATARATPGEPASVWAIDAKWLWQRALTRLDPWLTEGLHLALWDDHDPEFIDALLLGDQPAAVFPLNAMRLNSRLAAQQGVFLAPTVLTRSFMDNLGATIGIQPSRDHFQRVSISLSHTELRRVLQGLRRMGVTGVSLFPDLPGLAEGLETFMVAEFPIREAELRAV